MWTQKYYELDLIRPKVKSLSKQYPIDPKNNKYFE